MVKSINGKAASVPGGLAAGGVTSLGLTLALTAVIAKAVSAGILPQSNIGYAVMVLLFAASFAGAMMTQFRIKHRRMLMCVLSGIIYFLLLISMTALFFGGQYSAVGVTGAVVFAGAGTAALLTTGRAGKHSRSGYGRR